MTAVTTETPNAQTLTQRARLRTVLNRRRRFWRSLLVFVFAVVVMTFVALANRDAQTLRAARKGSAAIAQALQQHLDERHYPPLTVPLLPAPYADLDQHYSFNIFYVGAARDLGQAGVCCMRKPLHFFVLSDGRSAVLFDGTHFSAEWMRESEFRARADQLGFGNLLDE